MGRRPRSGLAACLAAALCVAPAAPHARAEEPADHFSTLWGEAGERWNDRSPLPGFSFAGYRWGEAPLPSAPDVPAERPPGVTGDGVTDDAPALQAALNAGSVRLPAGRYVLGKPLMIRKSGVVLRGEGVGKTVFVIPRPLLEVQPPPGGSSDNRYAFSGAFVMLRGVFRGKKLAAVNASAARGDRTLTLDAPITLAPGTPIRLIVPGSEDLAGQLLAGGEPGSATMKEYKNFVERVARATSCDGARVTLDRPLRTALRPDWKAEVWSWEPTLVDAGIEDLTFEFAGVKKRPHLSEAGFNAIEVFEAAHCFVRRVEIVDADIGLTARTAVACTFEQVTLRAARRENPSGHHALWAVRLTQDCLFSGFDIQTQFVHDLSVEGFACGNVFMNGRGKRINFDHHRNVPYENLFTNIDVGDAGRLWESSGSPDRGPHSGVGEVFWNLRAGEKSGKVDPPRFPNSILVGVAGTKARKPDPPDANVELPGGVTPINLHEAQLKRRLAPR